MRQKRHKKIVELVKSRDIGTQEELTNLLRDAGYRVTQSTVSRDIKELRLVKKTTASGKAFYSVSVREDSLIGERFRRILKDTVQDIKAAENIIVIKTLSGCANAAGEAIDTTSYPNIVGTLAGDNTLLVIVDHKENVPEIMSQFKEIIK